MATYNYQNDTEIVYQREYNDLPLEEMLLNLEHIENVEKKELNCKHIENRLETRSIVRFIIPNYAVNNTTVQLRYMNFH